MMTKVILPTQNLLTRLIHSQYTRHGMVNQQEVLDLVYLQMIKEHQKRQLNLQMEMHRLLQIRRMFGQENSRKNYLSISLMKMVSL